MRRRQAAQGIANLARTESTLQHADEIHRSRIDKPATHLRAPSTSEEMGPVGQEGIRKQKVQIGQAIGIERFSPHLLLPYLCQDDLNRCQMIVAWLKAFICRLTDCLNKRFRLLPRTFVVAPSGSIQALGVETRQEIHRIHGFTCNRKRQKARRSLEALTKTFANPPG
jgi:hypothetical protein